MADKTEKKKRAEASALTIARRLADLRSNFSEREWVLAAGVSTSFFSNLRGTPTKPPSDPSVDNLRQILRVRGVTLSEFFLSEAQGRVSLSPTRRDVERALSDALFRLPKNRADQARYLAEAVEGVLALPLDQPTIASDAGPEVMDDREEGAPPRVATKRK